MSKEYVSNWFNKLGMGEQDLPLILLNGIVYTPRATYNEVARGTPVGTQLQTLIESGKFGTSASDAQSIAQTRLQQRLSQLPNKPLFATLSNKVFTPQQLLEQIQAGTTIGQQWVNNEISHMSKLMQIG